MNKAQFRRDSYGWLATAYHEAGHAVAALLLGRTLVMVEIHSPSSGAAWLNDIGDRLDMLIDVANEQQCIPAELLRLWRDEFWISDAGAVCEAEFNLVSESDLARGSFNDVVAKAMLIPDSEQYAFVKSYFHRHVGTWQHLITEACRAFFRQPRVSSLARTLGEALLRTRRMDGEVVIDTLLANRAALTGQMDLFWEPVDNNLFTRSVSHPYPKQMRLL